VLACCLLWIEILWNEEMILFPMKKGPKFKAELLTNYKPSRANEGQSNSMDEGVFGLKD
jgi:hypothetical protein